MSWLHQLLILYASGIPALTSNMILMEDGITIEDIEAFEREALPLLEHPSCKSYEELENQLLQYGYSPCVSSLVSPLRREYILQEEEEEDEDDDEDDIEQQVDVLLEPIRQQIIDFSALCEQIIEDRQLMINELKTEVSLLQVEHRKGSGKQRSRAKKDGEHPGPIKKRKTAEESSKPSSQQSHVYPQYRLALPVIAFAPPAAPVVSSPPPTSGSANNNTVFYPLEQLFPGVLAAHNHTI